MKLFVFHTPEAVPTDRQPDCAIAVDVLRATTTIATALQAGANGVQAFSDLQELIDTSDTWPAPHRIRIGERGGKKVDGFDLGNSPLDCKPQVVEGSRIFMSTTNGTRALACIRSAPIVLTAALVNRQAVVQYLQTHQPETVWIVGSGWEGTYSLEDTVCAGAIVDGLVQAGLSLDTLAANDEVVAAVALYRQFKTDLFGLFKHSSHGQRLLHLGLIQDLEYCAQTDTLPIVPIQDEQGVLQRGLKTEL